MHQISLVAMSAIDATQGKAGIMKLEVMLWVQTCNKEEDWIKSGLGEV